MIQRLVLTLDAERDRWFLWWPVLFGTGVSGYFALSFEPPLTILVAAAGAASFFHFVSRRNGLWVVPAAAIAAIACGSAAAKFRTESVRAPVLADEGVRVTLTGWLHLVEPRPNGGQRLTIRVASVNRMAREDWPALVRVSSRYAVTALSPGEFLSVAAVLSPPPGPALPGAFDFARSAWFQRLGAVGFATGRPEMVPPPGAPPFSVSVSAAIEATRLSITRRITSALPGETGAIAAALITGERGGISDETNNAYRVSGLFHVLSISGLHMVVMAGALFWLVRLLLATVPGLVLQLPARKIAAVIALLGALGYLLISGAAVATVRSYVMISIMFLAVLLDRPAVALRNVAIAASVILLLAPESILDPGFQMSFAAVTALVAVHEALRVRRERLDRLGVGAARLPGPVRLLQEIVLSTVIASVAVAPFGIYHFHNTQTMALLANIGAIPVCNLLVMPAALATMIAMPFGLEQAPLQLMGWGITLMNEVAARVAAIPGAIWRLPDIPVSAFVMMVAGGLWLLLWRTSWRYAGLAAVVAGMALAPFQPRVDLIIGRDGNALAYRQTDGTLGIIAPAAAAFEATRWLEHDGDDRTLTAARAATTARCDQSACAASVDNRPLALLLHPVAVAEECARATILVAAFDLPAACRHQRSAAAADGGAMSPAAPPPITIDRVALRQRDVVTIRFAEDGRTVVQSTNAPRFRRPWGQTSFPAAN